MIKSVVDIVNFNADASCLDSDVWLKALAGGSESTFYSWLELYVENEKKVVMGFPGATLADIAQFNPESIELIKSNPNIFELILRPFAHDNALLRTRYGFEKNLEYGKKTLLKLFGVEPNYFLPPEFMCNSEQVYILEKQGIKTTFVSRNRFSEEAKSRIPIHPYVIRGVHGSEMNCIPFYGKLTKGFLEGIHFFNADKWNSVIENSNSTQLFNWRDGESAFLLPDTVGRERAWLKGEGSHFKRQHFNQIDIHYTANNELEDVKYKSYPLHSFAPWLKEMRMIGFTSKVAKIEEILESLSESKLFHWLQIINSDILSSVEKDSPLIKIQKSATDKEKMDFRIWRSERAFEGEDYLTLLKESEKENGHASYSGKSTSGHILKFNARVEFLESLV